MEKQEFSDALKGAVEASGMGFSELARLVPCDESVIRRVVAGVCPSVVRADAILRALDVNLVIGAPLSHDTLRVGTQAVDRTAPASNPMTCDKGLV